MSDNFNKVVRLGTIKSHNGRGMNIFCKIEFKQGKLSISGVEGPLSSGNCLGGCGQIDMHLREQVADITPAPGWDLTKLRKFFEVWKEWHLNDMKAGCEHQRASWDLNEQLTIYYFVLKVDVIMRKKKLEERALKALAAGGQVAYTPEEQSLASLPYKISREEETLPEELSVYYEVPKGGLGERKKINTAGWFRPDEHSRGLLAKACEVCGYKYGTSWLKVEVPEEVLAFLRELPVTDKQPAWV